MQLDLRLLTVADYHCMMQAGVFAPDERVELLEGKIIRMAAKGTAHSAAITRIERLLKQRINQQVLLRLQDPVALSDYSEPEPDIAVVFPDPLDYETHHPTPAEIYLLIEVSDTTLPYDLTTKALAYAQAGIADYWVFDVNACRLHVFREPTDQGYQRQLSLAAATTISPLSFPDCEMVIGEMGRSPT
jgi:Uma2 family endonuclease